VKLAVFLRAINVGTVNRIRMEDLRCLLASTGFGFYATYLQTGNLVLESDHDAEATAGRIEAALAAHGLKNATAMVRTQAELAEVVAACPFGSYPGDQFRQLVTFFRVPIEPAIAEALRPMPGVVGVRERELLTVSPLAEPMPAVVAPPAMRKVISAGTARYWKVAAALLAKMDE
jgi:uncharacterized protein (DUF1697 family)